MAKVRCLQSFYLISENKVLNYNDELEIKDEKLVKSLAEQGYLDVLIDEQPVRKPRKAPAKKATPKKTGEK